MTTNLPPGPWQYMPSDHSDEYGMILDANGELVANFVSVAAAPHILRAEREADKTPISDDWLRSVGGSKDEHPAKWTFHREDALSIGLWHVDDSWKAMVIHHAAAQSCLVRGLTIRGEFRTLARGLKIKLDEPTEPPTTA